MTKNSARQSLLVAETLLFRGRQALGVLGFLLLILPAVPSSAALGGDLNHPPPTTGCQPYSPPGS
jgi:hypothetical protein